MARSYKKNARGHQIKLTYIQEMNKIETKMERQYSKRPKRPCSKQIERERNRMKAVCI